MSWIERWKSFLTMLAFATKNAPPPARRAATTMPAASVTQSHFERVSRFRNGDAIPRGDVAREFGLRPGVPLREQGYPNGIPIEIRTFPGADQ
ncbi:hypothetical protein [Tsuneonella flava]|uniref:hypothetical protein n=1 Tax=Tsuneonella flava TaxID=2055955 RepID=UPI0012FFE5C9|nr:hypothetical protein [Tsuneonella flava]